MEEVILWSFPYLVIAGILWVVYARKTAYSKKLLAQAIDGTNITSPAEAICLLKEALWKANEKPDLERSILSELAIQYQRQGIPFEDQDYMVLIGQCRELSKKGSTKAFGEMQKVQALKKKIIDRMPTVPGASVPAASM